MSSTRVTEMLLACFIMICPGALQSQSVESNGRMKQETPELGGVTEPPKELEELQAWLGRLVGQFRIVVTGSDTGRLTQWRGSADCAPVGTGPGVHCIFNVAHRGGGSLTMFPKVILYGITPDVPGITYMEVNARSRAEGATGSLKDDMAYFNVRCPLIGGNGFEPVSCRRVVRISAPPLGRFVELLVRTYERPFWSSEEEAQHMEFYQLQRQPTESKEPSAAQPEQMVP